MPIPVLLGTLEGGLEVCVQTEPPQHPPVLCFVCVGEQSQSAQTLLVAEI